MSAPSMSSKSTRPIYPDAAAWSDEYKSEYADDGSPERVARTASLSKGGEDKRIWFPVAANGAGVESQVPTLVNAGSGIYRTGFCNSPGTSTAATPLSMTTFRL